MPAFFPCATSNFQNAWRVEPPRRARNEQERAGPAASSSGRARSTIWPHRRQAPISHGRDSLLVPFSYGAQTPGFELQVRNADRAQLGDSQAGCVEQLEHGAVPQARRLGRSGAVQQAHLSDLDSAI